jgi:NifB/MoaA-like Fe-S oxidoreductase
MIKGQGKSTFVQKMTTTREKIEHFLKADPSLADDDERLVSNIWHLEAIKLGHNPETITGKDFLKMYAEKQFTSADVITRARRKVEEETPELRGETWEKRQGMETEVREQINQPVKRMRHTSSTNKPSI